MASIEEANLLFKNLITYEKSVVMAKKYVKYHKAVVEDLKRLETLEEENQELKNKYEKLKTKYSNIRKYPPINQALMNYDEIDWEILKDEYGEEVFGNDK